MREKLDELARRYDELTARMADPAIYEQKGAYQKLAREVGELEPLRDVERRHILAVYEAVGNNKSQAARVLEIGLQTIHRKLKAYGVK